MKQQPSKQQGMTLIEAIAALIVLAFLAAYLLLPLEVGFLNADRLNQNTHAAYLAQGRMEPIFAKKQESGINFSILSDPCPGADICNASPGFSITSSITPTLSSTHYKLITVGVSGNGHSQLQLIVSNHDAP